MGVNGIYGLSGSGMDIESMVKVGMMAKQNEYDKMAQKYTKNEWIKADYLELSNQISTFNTSTLSQYKMSTNMNAKSAESTSSAVKVTAGSAAPLMNHQVEVSRLSSNAYLISTGTFTQYSNGISSDSSLALGNKLFKNLTVNNDDTVSGTTLNGRSFSNINVNSNAIEFTLSDGVTKNADNSIKTETISLKYKQLLDGATMNDLVSQINSKGLNVRATYDSVNETFSLYNTNGGAANTIAIGITAQDKGTIDRFYDVTENSRQKVSTTTDFTNVTNSNTVGLLNGLKLYQSKDGKLYTPGSATTKDAGGNALSFSGGNDNVTVNIHVKNTTDSSYSKESESHLNTSSGTKTTTGENGIIKVDGVTYSDQVTDNKITVNGVTYTAMATTTDKATVSISQDTDAIIDKVKSFIADYNKLLGSLYAKYDEKPNSDYKPLTQTQKDSMKDEQIEKWEEKAKQGLLYHDQTIGKIIQEMRSAITDTVEGVDGQYNSVFSLGISTTGIKGQLVLDEDKLKKALAADPDAVYNVFAKLDSADLDNKAKSGVAQRLGDVFVNATKNIKSRAGSSSDITEDSDLNNLLRNLQTRMSNFKKMMTTYENALYKKYDAMETMLTKLGTQLNFVMGSSS